MDKCVKLMEYSKFIDVLRENKKKYRPKRAVLETIDYCIDNNILANFLKMHRAQVPGFLISSFDKRKYLRTIREEAYDEGEAEGRTAGRAEGRAEERRSLLIAQVKDGEITIDSAAKRLGVKTEEFEKLLN